MQSVAIFDLADNIGVVEVGQFLFNVMNIKVLYLFVRDTFFPVLYGNHHIFLDLIKERTFV